MSATYESKGVSVTGTPALLLDDQDEDRLVFINNNSVGLLVGYTSGSALVQLAGSSTNAQGVINGFILPAGYELWGKDQYSGSGTVYVFTTKAPQPGSLTFTCS